MTTWTYSTHLIALVVTSDNIDLAVETAQLALYARKIDNVKVERKDLIPLPTHHRHLRTLWFKEEE